MKNLVPTLREKKRYLVFEVVGDANSNSSVAAVNGVFSSLFGSLESAAANIKAVKSAGRRCMVSVGRKHVDKLKAAIAMVKSINNRDVILRSVGVSGALNAAVSKYMNERGVM